MEQRRLRLGDILDDYCPRERRLTNHAVVAMVEDTVKQTRCTTCDAEHPYKGGQAPKRKRKDAPAPAVLASPAPDAPAPLAAVVPAAPVMVDAPGDDFQDDDVSADVATASENVAQEYLADTARAADDAEPNPPAIEDGPVHRPLIRATLPRPEGQKDARTPPDFTIRQAGGRGGNAPGNQQFRGGGGGNRGRQRTGHGGNGHRSFGGNAPGNFGGSRFGARPGQGQGQNRGQGGFRSAQQPRQGQGGRKRSR
jgi:hypothetical protein